MEDFKILDEKDKQIFSKRKTSVKDVLKLELEARGVSYKEFINSYYPLKMFLNNEDLSYKDSCFEYLEESLGIDKGFWERIYNQSKQ